MCKVKLTLQFCLIARVSEFMPAKLWSTPPRAFDNNLISSDGHLITERVLHYFSDGIIFLFPTNRIALSKIIINNLLH